MLNQFSRTQLLLGQDGMERLYNAHAAVFGIGGVGGYTVEALVRSGVGTCQSGYGIIWAVGVGRIFVV